MFSEGLRKGQLERDLTGNTGTLTEKKGKKCNSKELWALAEGPETLGNLHPCSCLQITWRWPWVSWSYLEVALLWVRAWTREVPTSLNLSVNNSKEDLKTFVIFWLISSFVQFQWKPAIIKSWYNNNFKFTCWTFMNSTSPVSDFPPSSSTGSHLLSCQM